MRLVDTRRKQTGTHIKKVLWLENMLNSSEFVKRLICSLSILLRFKLIRSAWGHRPFKKSICAPANVCRACLNMSLYIFFSHNIYFVKWTSPFCSRSAPKAWCCHHHTSQLGRYSASHVFLQMHRLSSWPNSWVFLPPDQRISVPIWSSLAFFFYGGAELTSSSSKSNLPAHDGQDWLYWGGDQFTSFSQHPRTFFCSIYGVDLHISHQEMFNSGTLNPSPSWVLRWLYIPMFFFFFFFIYPSVLLSLKKGALCLGVGHQLIQMNSLMRSFLSSECISKFSFCLKTQ